MSQNKFFIDPEPPFRLDLTVWILRRRPENIVDRWDGQTYSHVLRASGNLVEVQIRQTGPPQKPRLEVVVDNPSPESDLQQFITLSIERLLGLRVDLSEFYRFTAKHGGPLEDLAQRFRGCKPPRFTSIFESIINAIASQQVSRTVAILILNRLTVKYGAVIHKNDFPCYAFPTPEDLAKVRPGDLRELGFSLNKGAAITELAQSIAGGDLKLEELSELSDEKAIQRLCSLRGIGRWTAEYVLLRGFGRTHIFPSADAGVRHSLKLWLKISEAIDYPMVHRILSNWHPYGGLVYFHLLLDRLSDAGYLSAKHSLASHKENPQ